MKKTSLNLSFQSGVGLVELMIALTLTLILTMGVVQVYIANKQTYRTADSLSRIQENARFSLEMLAKEIRMAGYRGCMSKTPVDITNTLNNSSSTAWDFETGLQGFDNVGGTLPSELASHLAATDPVPRAGSDVLIIRGPAGSDVNVVKNNNSSQLFGEYKVTGEVCGNGSASISGLCLGDVVMVSDCQKARVFQITNLTVTAGNTEINVVHSAAGSNPGNAETSWGGSSTSPDEQFGPNSQIIRMQTVTYYVAEEPGTGLSALYRKVNNQAAVVMVEGIRDLQLNYGVDTSKDFRVDEYRNAAAVADWEEVLSVQADLLLTSPENNIVDTPQTLTFAGGTFTATDRRLYQVAGITAVLRNRVP